MPLRMVLEGLMDSCSIGMLWPASCVCGVHRVGVAPSTHHCHALRQPLAQVPASCATCRPPEGVSQPPPHL